MWNGPIGRSQVFGDRSRYTWTFHVSPSGSFLPYSCCCWCRAGIWSTRIYEALTSWTQQTPARDFLQFSLNWHLPGFPGHLPGAILSRPTLQLPGSPSGLDVILASGGLSPHCLTVVLSAFSGGQGCPRPSQIGSKRGCAASWELLQEG